MIPSSSHPNPPNPPFPSLKNPTTQVYTSQDQLGGPQIMSPNGVSHMVVDNDKEGISAILDWLSFVPKASAGGGSMDANGGWRDG